MTENDRVAVWASVIRALVSEGMDVTTMTDAIRDAVDSGDDWIEFYKASFDAALPDPFRTWANSRQKMLLFVRLIERRYGVMT